MALRADGLRVVVPLHDHPAKAVVFESVDDVVGGIKNSSTRARHINQRVAVDLYGDAAELVVLPREGARDARAPVLPANPDSLTLRSSESYSKIVNRPLRSTRRSRLPALL